MERVLQYFQERRVIYRRDEQEGVEDFNPAMIGVSAERLFQRRKYWVPRKGRVMKVGANAGCPGGQVLVQLIGQARDSGKNISCVLMFFIFGGFHERWKE